MAKPTSSTPPLVELVRHSPAQRKEVEKWIMYAMIHDFDFWLMCQERVCKDPETLKDIDDFNKPEYNAIFKAMRIFNTLKEEGYAGPFAPTVEAMKGILELQADGGNVCTMDEVPAILEVYSILYDSGDTAKSWLGTAKSVFPHWLSISRAGYVANGATDATLDELVDAAEKQSDAVATTQDEDIILYGTQVRAPKPKNSVSLSGFPLLSSKLGNFRYGNGYLFQAPSGGGKTVMACQLVHEFVSQGLKGVLITTEQGFDELEPRFISLACTINIKHAGLEQGVDIELLRTDKHDPSIFTRYNEWEQLAKEMFVVYPWGSDNSQSIHTDLEATIRKVTKLLGQPPQFVILDWIGGALGADVAPEFMRVAYQKAANAFAASAKKHKYIGCAMAQTVGNKHLMKLDASTLAECKTMHTKFCSLIGITAIETLDRTGEESTDPNNNKKGKHPPAQLPETVKLVKDLYREEQFFDISKARFGKPGRIAIKREFEYQRFRELRDIDIKN